VEAAGVEPASAQATHQRLHAYSVIKFHHVTCPRTSQWHRNRPVDSRPSTRSPGLGSQPV